MLTSAQLVQRLLLRGLTDIPDTPQAASELAAALQEQRLGGYCYRRLPQGSPLRAALQPEYLALTARHMLIRQELRELVAAWNAENLPVMLIKGFALAEFEYSAPAERFYGDVDILVPSDLQVITRMVNLALARGWRSDGQHADPLRWTHECAHLWSPNGQARLDVHHLVTGWVSGSQRRQRALTRAIWQGAALRDWQGLQVYRPSAADQLVINVALGRCWGGDAGGLKPADYTDMALLTEHYRLSDTQLLRRAEQLGAARTWQAFRAVCDPAGHRFAYQQAATQSTLLRGAAHDGYVAALVPWCQRLKLLPRRLHWMTRLVPDIWAAHRAWQSGKDPRLFLRRWQPAKVLGRAVSATEQQDIAGAINWWMRLLYPRQRKQGVCVPRAYATFRSLHRLGLPVTFVSGVARTPAGIVGHAWIEDRYGVPDWYDEPLARQRYHEQLRWPCAEK